MEKYDQAREAAAMADASMETRKQPEDKEDPEGKALEEELSKIRGEMWYGNLPEQIDEEMRAAFGDKDTMEKALEGTAIGDAMKDLSLETPVHERLQKLADVKVPLMSLFGIQSKVKKFIATSPGLRRLTELSMRHEELESQIKARSKARGQY